MCCILITQYLINNLSYPCNINLLHSSAVFNKSYYTSIINKHFFTLKLMPDSVPVLMHTLVSWHQLKDSYDWKTLVPTSTQHKTHSVLILSVQIFGLWDTKSVGTLVQYWNTCSDLKLHKPWAAIHKNATGINRQGLQPRYSQRIHII